MFKLKNIAILLLLVLITFTVFDGRISSHRALDKSILDFKDKTTLTSINYIPETYTERVTDTILSNGYRVKIKTSTDMQSQLKIKSTENTIVREDFYRHHSIEIELETEKLGTATTILDHNTFENINDRLVLKAAYLDEEASIFKDGIYIQLHFLEPKSQKEEVFDMIMNDNGTYNITPKDART